jgi:outer membrane protein OmpA-like peptidoglycan-associated protein
MSSFCNQCGTRFEEFARFCSGCGAVRAAENAVPIVAAGAVINNAVPEVSGGAASSGRPASGKSGNGLLGVIVLVASILLLLGLLGLGGCVYVAYRIKNKTMEVAESVTQQGQEALKVPLDSASGDQNANGSAPAQDVRCPAAPSVTASDKAAIVPLGPGLTIVDAWHVSYGDYELIENADSFAADSVRFFMSDGANHNEVYRTICREDLQTAHAYKTGFGDGDPEVFRGTTLFSVSAAVLNDLKTKRRATFTYTQTVDEADDAAGKTASRRLEHDGFTWDEWSGELVQVEPDDTLIPVIVNDQRVELPAVHARGMLGKELTELWVVDDPLNPVTLRFAQPNSKFSLQVVKISFPGGEAPKIEQSLKQKGTAEVHGIYFDFGSDRIRRESEPVLKEIADAMKTNSWWNLSIEGHTDNIGGDQYNQRLSERRAAAVKSALVERYSIDNSRLKTAGFGASQPKESNNTLEGRAWNRRVELVRH